MQWSRKMYLFFLLFQPQHKIVHFSSKLWVQRPYLEDLVSFKSLFKLSSQFVWIFCFCVRTTAYQAKQLRLISLLYMQFSNISVQFDIDCTFDFFIGNEFLFFSSSQCNGTNQAMLNIFGRVSGHFYSPWL